MIALSGPPGNGWSLAVAVGLLLVGIAILAEFLGRREMRKRADRGPWRRDLGGARVPASPDRFAPRARQREPARRAL